MVLPDRGSLARSYREQPGERLGNSLGRCFGEILTLVLQSLEHPPKAGVTSECFVGMTTGSKMAGTQGVELRKLAAIS